jgi:Tfp pilus assembly protein PilP
VARNHLAAALVAVLALAACGKSKAADADTAATQKFTALRAHNDSVRKARLAATPHTDTTQAAVATVATPPVAARPDSIRPDAVQPDSIAADSTRGHETEVQRETFAYAGGTRDPFGSLMNLKSAGPELADLQLVGVYQDLRNSANSVAVLREKVTSRRHKVRVGDQLGRLRVRQILARDVVFNIEDFGYERQETLSLRKQEDVTP